jgi:8-oxo-dGTP pyrophosphatase MutT (NUDIX family)
MESMKKKASGAGGKQLAMKARKRIGKSSVANRIAPKKKRAKQKIEVVSSKLSYSGPLFRVFTDQIRENGKELRRDVIRHDGSAVILAIDDSNKRDPLVVLERQYRHAAGGYLLEVPAGKLEPDENPLAGAKRELLEETGIQAKHWRKLVRYFASPGFLGEWMQVFVAEGLSTGEAQPEYDEQIDVEIVPVSQLLRMIQEGKIQDGKTLISVMLYDLLRRHKRFPVTRKK